jgi:hypothetical protein
MYEKICRILVAKGNRKRTHGSVERVITLKLCLGKGIIKG